MQNCLQDLTSRIAGVDNEMMTNRGMGMGTAIGYSLGTIKGQFSTLQNNSTSNNANGQSSSGGGLSGIVSRAKTIVSPGTQLSAEKDYNGNINPIRNVEDKNKDNKQITLPKSDGKNVDTNMSSQKSHSAGSTLGNVAKAGAYGTKAYLSVGAKMAEGDFSSYNNKSNIQQKEYVSEKNRQVNEAKNLGDLNEYEE